MRTFTFILLIQVILFSSCEHKPVHPALWTIGNHSKKFQKVLEYYKAPKDSLKLKAAEFLIQNMDKHYYYHAKNEEKLDSFIQYLNKASQLPNSMNQELRVELRKELINKNANEAVAEGRYKWSEYSKRSDLKNISPEFLIENIEYAFKAWNLPWARSISFEDFCTYILPYRYGHEPLSSWRKEIYETYNWLADSLSKVTNPMEAAVWLNEQFANKISKPEKIKGFKFTISEQLNLMVYRSCLDQSGLGVCFFRALGIPSTKINIPFVRGFRIGHNLTAVLDNKNNWHYLNFGDPKSEKELNYHAPKMFLYRFDKMKRFKPIPIDLTKHLMKVNNLEINIKPNITDDTYLCVFRNLVWGPITKGKNLNSKVSFKNISDKSNMYLVATDSRGKLNAESYPFSTDSLGNISYYKPNYSKLNTATFCRKYPTHNRNIRRLKSLIGGEFSVSDDKLFTNKKELYRIDSSLKYDNNIIKCSEQAGKYLRYEFPSSVDSNFDGPAEISFYTTVNNNIKKIEGTYFGSPQLSKHHLNLISDNDMLTYLEVWDCSENLDEETGKIVLREEKQPIWIGMELDSATMVTHVGICPRNDKNGIYPGMCYELFYWDDEWISLGAKVATSDTISFDLIPDNSVLWLRNLDEGIEERIFTMKDGVQEWW